MKKVGIVGGAGYTAGELIRLLINHPKVNISFIYSTSNADNKLSQVHQDLIGATDMKFTDSVNLDVDILFLCLGHGNSKSFLEKQAFSSQTKIIDLSNDFRLNDDANFQGKQFIYGLPELNYTALKSANYIANPGCFATAIQSAILPLAKENLLKSDIHVNATTGSTGAGVSLSPTSHFSWRDNNFSSYKVFSHQHLGEIGESVKQLQADFYNDINFVPNRGNFCRGIYATTYTFFDGTLDDAIMLYQDFYEDAKFTIVSDLQVHLKQVVNTNKCVLHLAKHGNKILITSAIDNLIKGASGQAIHNMNLMYGFEETVGLNLKGSAF